MQPAFSKLDVFLTRHGRATDVHCDPPGPPQRIPFALVFDVVCGNDNHKHRDVEIRGEEIRCAKRVQKRTPAIEDEQEAAPYQAVRRARPLQV